MKILNRILCFLPVSFIYFIVYITNYVRTLFYYIRYGGELHVYKDQNYTTKNLSEVVYNIENLTRVNEECIRYLKELNYPNIEVITPSLYGVHTWIRKKFNEIIVVEKFEGHYYFYTCKNSDESDAIYSTYEEAFQAALIFCLKNYKK